MKLRSIELFEVRIPLTVNFQHASADRASTETVLVKAMDELGNIGWGEGCPRQYVTNESIQSCKRFFNEYKTQIIVINSVEKLKNWILTHDTEINLNPAAFCAVEMALLDLMCKSHCCSIESLLKLPKLDTSSIYSGVIGTKSTRLFSELVKQYQVMGVEQLKVKLTGDYSIDSANLNILRKNFGDMGQIRFDANNLWRSAPQVDHYLTRLKLENPLLEEPLGVFEIDECRELCKVTERRIILDESVTCPSHISALQYDPSNWIINIRVSKMGGIIRSLEIARSAQEHGISLIVGAQVGETSLLTRAGLVIASTFRSQIVAQEGAFGCYLLTHDIHREAITFGESGRLNYSSIPKFGISHSDKMTKMSSEFQKKLISLSC